MRVPYSCSTNSSSLCGRVIACVNKNLTRLADGKSNDLVNFCEATSVCINSQLYNISQNLPTSLTYFPPAVAAYLRTLPGYTVTGDIFLSLSNDVLEWGSGGGTGSVTSVGLTSTDITVGGASPITSSGVFTLTLPNINPNIGVFNTVTVNAKGQVTSATNVDYLEPLEFLGIRYSATSWTNTSDFTNSGSTPTIVANRIAFASGGASNFTASLGLTPPTMLENWKATIGFIVDVKDGSSTGVGLGIKSINNNINTAVKFDMTTGADGGKISIRVGSSYTQVAISSALSFSIGDSIEMSIERIIDRVYVTAKNITTSSALVSCNWRHLYSDGATMNNTGRVSIYELSPSFTVYKLIYESSEIKDSDILFIGDSKTSGYYASDYWDSFSHLFKFSSPNSVIHAGPGDSTVDVIQAIQEIIDLAPKQVVLAIGSNDIRNGLSGYIARYDSIVTTLTAAGVDVWHLEPLYESSGLDQTPLLNHIRVTYPTRIIAIYDAIQANPTAYLYADGVHFTDAGNRFIYETIISTYNLIGDRNVTTPEFAIRNRNSTVQENAGFDINLASRVRNNFTVDNDLTASTRVFTPFIAGGTGLSSALTIQPTTGNGTLGSNSDIYFKTGNNGSVNAMSILSTGVVLINTTSAVDPITGFSRFKAVDGVMELSFRDHVSGQGYLSISNGTIKGYVGNTSNTLGFTCGTSTSDRLTFVVGNTSRLTIDTGAHTGLTITNPTAWFHLPAGLAFATYAPLKFTTGANMPTAEAGAVEYTTPQLFFTNEGAQRQELFQGQQSRVSTQFDKANATLANITGLTATLVAGKIYRFEAILYTTSNVASGVKFAVAGTATATNIIYEAIVYQGGLAVATGTQRATALATTVGDVTAVTTARVTISGTIIVNAAGTLTVQFADNTGTNTSSVLVGSTFVVIEMV